MTTPPIGRSRSNSHAHPDEKNQKPVRTHNPPPSYAFGSAIGTSRIPVSTIKKSPSKKALPGSTTEVTVDKSGHATPQQASPAGAIELLVVEPKSDKKRTITKAPSLSFLTASTAATRARQQKPVRAKEAEEPDDSKHVIKAGSVTPREKMTKPVVPSGSLPIPSKEPARPSLTDVFQNAVGSPREVVIGGRGKKPSPVVTPRQDTTPPNLPLPTTPRTVEKPTPLQTPQPVAASAPPLTVPSPVIESSTTPRKPIPQQASGPLKLTTLKDLFQPFTMDEIQNAVLSETYRMSVTELELSGPEVLDELLAAVIGRFPRLSTVRLTRCPNLTDQGLNALKDVELASLTISECPKLTQDGLLALHLEDLKVFRLSVLFSIDESLLEKFVVSERIEHICLQNCRSLVPNALLAFQRARQSFRLQLTECPPVAGDIFAQMNEGRTHPIRIDGQALPLAVHTNGIRSPSPNPSPKPPVTPPKDPSPPSTLRLPTTPPAIARPLPVYNPPPIQEAPPSPEPEATTPRGSLRRKSKVDAPAIDATLFDTALFEYTSNTDVKVAAMVKQALESARTGSALPPPPEVTPLPPRSILKKEKRTLGEALDVMILNALAPGKLPGPRQSVHNRLFGTETVLDDILLTPAEILSLALSTEEMQGVKTLNLLNSSISDEQLMALIQRFPGLEKVALVDCPKLTDRGIQPLLQLKKLKCLEVRYCEGIKAAGIASLPLNQLVEFGLATEEEIASPVGEKLARSPVLKKVDFDLCSHLLPGALLALKKAHDGFPIALSVKGCDQISPSFLEKLNEGRDEPFVIDYSIDPFPIPSLTADSSDKPRRSIAIPPELEDAPDILSNSKYVNVFGHNTLRLPHCSAIEEHDFKGTTFRGIDLIGRFHNDSLDALIKKFPNMEMVRIWNNPLLNEAILLSSLEKIRVLRLGKLGWMPWHRIEVMFSKPGAWQKLEELYFSGIAITDEALSSLSKLPQFKKLILAHCESFTIKGLKHFLKCDSLKEISLIDCAGIDPFAIEEFRELRPDVIVTTDLDHDLTIAELAVTEAELRRGLPENEFVFYPKFDTLMHPKEKEINAFYAQKFELIGISYEPAFTKDEWLRRDLILQAYIHFHRICWSVRNQMIKVGFFTPMDNERPPMNAKEIIDSMRTNDKRRKVKALDFSQTEIRWIPSFVEECGYWEQVQEINATNTYIKEIPDSLKQLCPNVLKNEDVQKLSLSKRPGLTAKLIEDLFSKEIDATSWKELKELECVDAPVTDEALRAIALLPKLETLCLVNCHLCTVQGFKQLMKGGAALTKVIIDSCAGIDPLVIELFKTTRPLVLLEINALPESETVQLHRVAWALRKELIRVGALSPNEENFPTTGQEVIDLLNMPIPNRENTRYGDVIERFDFADLDLIEMPRFVEEYESWKSVETIDLRGNAISQPSAALKNRCPLILERERREATIPTEIDVPELKEERSPPGTLSKLWSKFKK